MMKYKINVLIITYNQEGVIGRALESVLIQKEWGLNQIIVCDDCSTDNNWEVISRYVEMYPNIITAYKNTSNLGIYGNCEKLVSLRGNADLFYILSGDDALCDGLFRHVHLLIEKKHIDVQNKAISLYFDWKVVTPKGKMIVFRNDKIEKGRDPFRLRYRLLIYNRSTFINSKVINQFKPVPLDKGITLSEDLFEFQYQQYSEESYYYSYVGSMYYSQLGISTKMRTKKNIEENIYKWEFFLKTFDLNKKDVAYTRMKLCLLRYSVKPTLIMFLNVLLYFIKSLDVKLGIDLKNIYFLLRSLIKSPFLSCK
ncbi:glycosyltransferase [Odoribacter sp. AF21-41]|jgi:glycosyltransferase|uniref:Glycosyltransferase n=2 Tax=Odoribacteraceae TaxID=1853231 RepID=A0A7X5YBQ3_9BACT|nr:MULTISPECIES: glycosyltransferase [Odoribacteraceae]NJC16607.1 glycosyltransferase involved in cell wall biosynthesis [Butyricimonas paravirosa]RGG49478.1 glycosyltransferase [Odoribacter sp. AF21-41]RHH94580.1 glycosyltransferase [Odoribacter sp. AM16-33]WOF12906.1 glycosyltransferase [Butyricimonas paravirosa]GGJ46748.1 hypothetical protein GCM10007042_01720 [Butyricimonas paravirosa]